MRIIDLLRKLNIFQHNHLHAKLWVILLSDLLKMVKSIISKIRQDFLNVIFPMKLISFIFKVLEKNKFYLEHEAFLMFQSDSLQTFLITSDFRLLLQPLVTKNMKIEKMVVFLKQNL